MNITLLKSCQRVGQSLLKKIDRSGHQNRILNNFRTMAHLKVSLTQDIQCEDVVKIAEKAAEAILAVYNSKVGTLICIPFLQPPVHLILRSLGCQLRMKIGT